MADYWDQSGFAVRCEWGLEGLQHLLPGSDVVIIVDIISFTTCVDVAVSRGARVYPYRWRDDRAAAFAQSQGALLAVSSRSDLQGFSLAPTSLMRLARGQDIVLPSPNGATLSLETGRVPTFAGCVRNAQAVANAARRQGERISIIAAGERWVEGGLRPGLEDLIGVGAIANALAVGNRASPEVQAAEAVFLRFAHDLPRTLLACGSGREAADRRSPEDVTLCAALNVSQTAPYLAAGAYQDTAN